MENQLDTLARADDLQTQMAVTNLAPLIFEIEGLMRDLGIARWSFLKAWCDECLPKDADANELELLLERLATVWADRQSADLEPITDA